MTIFIITQLEVSIFKFFKLANCTKDCANYIDKHPYLNKEDTNVVPIRLPFIKNGFSKYTIEENLAFFVPKGIKIKSLFLQKEEDSRDFHFYR